MPDPEPEEPPEVWQAASGIDPEPPEPTGTRPGRVPVGSLVVADGHLWAVEPDGWRDLGRVVSAEIDGRQLVPPARLDAEPEADQTQARLDAIEETLSEAESWERTWESRAHRWKPPEEPEG
jgi:hypothetical protein